MDVGRDERVDRAAVVGGGTSGRGIARVLAAAGIEVLLVERTSETLEHSQRALREGLERDIGRWALTESERDAMLARIRGVAGLPDLSGIQVLFEAVTEDLKEKRAVLEELDRRAPPDAVFLLSTSTLSITTLAEATSEGRRPLVIGLHFLHPVSRIALVELIRGRDTGGRAEAVARSLARRLDKEVVEVAEYPGYVTSRLTLGLINEAIHLVMEGVATRDVVDRAMKLRLGATHGPLALADEIGLDSVHRALESLWRELGLPQFRPAPLLRRMVSEGWLGEKSGRGFYRYDEAGVRRAENGDLEKPALDRLVDPRS
ncbi:MAG: 3-hydroxyacyl-CoA dehydrogenase family protein [bacterium]